MPVYNSKHTASEQFLLTKYPAVWIDACIRYSPHYWFGHNAQYACVRGVSLLISITVLPLFLLLDSLRYGLWSLVLLCAKRSFKHQDVRGCQTICLSCLLGFIAFPISLFWRDAVSHHYLPKKNRPSINPTGGLYQSHPTTVYPKNLEEVCDLVKAAVKDSKKIAIIGAGFSQGKHILPPLSSDVQVSLKKLNTIHIDPDQKCATVGAGVTWSALQLAADQHQLALKVAQASNVFSIGGSLGGANCHGWDHIHGSLGNIVSQIKIVNAQGEVETLTPDDELFSYVVGGYGLFGIIVEVTLELCDNTELLDSADCVELDHYIDYFDQHIQNNEAVHMHLYRLSLVNGKLLQYGWAQNYSVSKQSTATRELSHEPHRGTLQDRIFIQLARNSRQARALYWKTEEKALQTVRRATRNDSMHPKINAVFANNASAYQEWLQEYFVPREHLADFIRFLGRVLDENNVTLLNASVRYVIQDKRSKLSYAAKGERFAVVLFFSQLLNDREVKKTTRWVQRVIDRLIEIDGTFYLPYAHLATREQFRKCYPAYEAVSRKKHEVDPNNLFYTGFYQDYIA